MEYIILYQKVNVNILCKQYKKSKYWYIKMVKNDNSKKRIYLPIQDINNGVYNN